MGWRFRKRIAGGKFFRVNLSASGLSLGLGPPGFNVNIGPRGIRRTVGLPGTGISYQTSSNWPAPSASTSVAAQSTSAPSVPAGNGSARSSRVRWGPLIILVGIVVAIAQALFEKPPTIKQPTAVNAAPIAKAVEPRPTTESIRPPEMSLPDRGLTANEVRELQELLTKRGFNPGPADGVVGQRTRLAIQSFMRSQGQSTNGDATLKVLERAINAKP